MVVLDYDYSNYEFKIIDAYFEDLRDEGFAYSNLLEGFQYEKSVFT